MDTRPFRAPRPAAREASPRQELSPSRPEPPRVTTESPVGTPVSTREPAAKKPKKRWLKWFIILLVVIIAGAAVAMWLRSSSDSSQIGIEAGKYQAVHLTNGQIAIGKLQPIDDGYFKLSKAYRLESKTASSDSGATSTDSSNNVFQLVKLGSGEPYSPEGDIIIAKNQIFYFENLNPDGKASKFIKKDGNS